MANKIFSDINILIDLLDSKRKHHAEAVHLLNEAEKGNCYIFITESVLNTTAYLIRKDYSTIKLKELFNHLLSFAELIPVSSFIYSSGLQRMVNDVEDAILYAAALSANLDFFVTNDTKDFKKLEIPSLPVVSAREFLLLINK